MWWRLFCVVRQLHFSKGCDSDMDISFFASCIASRAGYDSAEEVDAEAVPEWPRTPSTLDGNEAFQQMREGWPNAQGFGAHPWMLGAQGSQCEHRPWQTQDP